MNCGNTGTKSSKMKGTSVKRRTASGGGSKSYSSQDLGKKSKAKTMKGY